MKSKDELINDRIILFKKYVNNNINIEDYINKVKDIDIAILGRDQFHSDNFISDDNKE